jgi:2-polyprenyl-3-methyl-5-hydroxy-6-metoxy-1,4-benzoquinol methylase
MDETTRQALIDLNRHFYHQFATSFAESRRNPQPGFKRLLAFLPAGEFTLLDVGCGEGRFGRFLRSQGMTVNYTGLDFSVELLAHAAEKLEGNFITADLSRAGCLDQLDHFDVVVCLATLQHLPGRHNRQRLLFEMATHLSQEGIIVMSNWQFMSSARQRRKILDWAVVGLSAGEVETNDYLLSWQRNGHGRRYVTYIDAGETSYLATGAGLEIIDQFQSDGREGDLNLYTILRSRQP